MSNLPQKIVNLKRPLEFFKTYDLHEIYGEDYVKYKTFDTKTAEDICQDMFLSMRKTEGNITNRGDFVCNGKYFDQKTVQVSNKLSTGERGKYFKVKYSNVLAKMFVQIVFKELDLIIEDIKNAGKWRKDNHSRLIYIRYKTEMNFDDMWYIDEQIIRNKDVKSYCGRNDMRFLWYINDLCTYNVKKFSHLILFHPPLYESQNHILERVDDETYMTYGKHGNYLVTAINMNLTNIYVDYIGFGGFKVYIPYNKVKKSSVNKHKKDMDEPIKELDEAINVALSVNNFKYVSGRTPWKEYEYDTDNWVERYKDEYINEPDWEHEEDV